MDYVYKGWSWVGSFNDPLKKGKSNLYILETDNTMERTFSFSFFLRKEKQLYSNETTHTFHYNDHMCLSCYSICYSISSLITVRKFNVS